MFKKRFPVKVGADFFPEHQNKRALFRYEIAGKLVAFVGAFEIHKDAKAHYVCVDCPTFPFLKNGPPGGLIYLSQAHIASISPAPAEEKEVDFVIERPFLRHHFVPESAPRRCVS